MLMHRLLSFLRGRGNANRFPPHEACTDNVSVQLAEEKARNALLIHQLYEVRTALKQSLIAADSEDLPRSNVIYANELVNHPALYALETYQGSAFRWMGREKDFFVATRLPPSRAVRIDADFLFVPDERVFAKLTITCDRQSATLTETTPLGDGGLRKTSFFRLHRREPLAFRMIGVHLERRGNPSSKADPRLLAVALSRICVENVSDADLKAMQAAIQSVSIMMDDPTVPETFYPLETDARGTTFRWLGPDVEAIFDTQVYAHDKLTIRIYIVHLTNQNVVSNLAVAVEGYIQQSSVVHSREGFKALLETKFVIDPDHEGDCVRIRLRTPQYIVDAPDDERKLSIAISQIVIERDLDGVIDAAQ